MSGLQGEMYCAATNVETLIESCFFNIVCVPSLVIMKYFGNEGLDLHTKIVPAKKDSKREARGVDAHQHRNPTQPFDHKIDAHHSPL